MEECVVAVVDDCTHQIIELLKKHPHTPSMIIDWIKRDRSDLWERLELAKQQIAPNNPHISFYKRLRRVLTNRFGLLRTPSLPNYLKAKYRHPEGTDLVSIYRNAAQRGAQKTTLLRKKNGTYVDNRPIELRVSSSPMSLAYYRARGISDEDAQLTIKRYAIKGAHAALKKQQQNKCEHFVQNVLSEIGVPFAAQFKFETFLFDFIIPSNNLVIEVNGTYWHCDPRFFKANDQVKFPGKIITAQTMWDKDANKRQRLENYGYRVLYIWEYDIVHEPEIVKGKIKNAVGRD
jgi:very-short-patch-repair endonuclease